MNILNRIFNSSSPKKSAQIAKERLKIIVAHERVKKNSGFDYFPKLQQELLAVVAKYFEIDEEVVRIELERQGDSALLELNITLPDSPVVKMKPEIKILEGTEIL